MKDQQLLDTLYNTYSNGGLRARLYFLHKKLAWRTVVGATELAKRGLDIVVAGLMLILLAPLFGIVALIIYKESPGPVFFFQNRVGRWGKLFRMYKFRSMVLNAEKLLEKLKEQNESGAGVIFKMKKDPRLLSQYSVVVVNSYSYPN